MGRRLKCGCRERRSVRLPALDCYNKWSVKNVSNDPDQCPLVQSTSLTEYHFFAEHHWDAFVISRFRLNLFQVGLLLFFFVMGLSINLGGPLALLGSLSSSQLATCVFGSPVWSRRF